MSWPSVLVLFLVSTILRPNVNFAFPFFHLSHMLFEESILDQVLNLVASVYCPSLVLQHLKLWYRFGLKLSDDSCFLLTQYVELLLVQVRCSASFLVF